jgi:hypothetical protein
MTTTLAITALLLFSQTNGGRTASGFTSPSQAWAYANAPVAEWEAAVQARRRPKNHFRPDGKLYQRAARLCPQFAVESFSGEELFWLAKLCESGSVFPEALSAVERYLAGDDAKHRAEAHLLLGVVDLRVSKTWEASWPVYRTVLQEDPIGPEQEIAVRVAIEDEADRDEATALRWSKERYELLLERARNPRTGTAPVSYFWIVMAGADLVHRYYLGENIAEGTALLAELNYLKESHAAEMPGPDDFLNWANMEMKPAPLIPVLKALGATPGADIVQMGRVEVLHFIFLRCSPCISQLGGLNDLQKRYKKENVLVANVTTYKAALQPDEPPPAKIEAALDRIRRKRSPLLSMSIAPEQSLQDYKITAYPVTAVVDKAGRLRYTGRSNQFDEGEEIDRLVRRLINEPAPN